jgi:Tfp pilus assembly protein FimV
VSENNGSSGAKPDLDALRAEIKQTRAELGETVQALTAKADVKARAKESVEQTKQKVKAQVAEATGKATDAVRSATHTVTTKVQSAADTASDKAPEVTEGVRRNPVPLGAVLIGVVAAIGVILIVRGRRR